jgi:hypothetical protein
LEALEAFRRFAADCFLALARRFVAGRRFAVVRGFAAVRRLAAVRVFRDEREVAARFLRFAICRLQSSAHHSSISTPMGNLERAQTGI